MEPRECMVCLDEFMTFITLPCQHEICLSCYPKIVQINSMCPICRHDFKEIRGEELYDIPVEDVQPVQAQVHDVYLSSYIDRRCFVVIMIGGCLLAFILYATHH
jgi:hypothetical protein